MKNDNDKNGVNSVHVSWWAIAFVSLWCAAIMVGTQSCTFPSNAKEKVADSYILVEREGYHTAYMTEAEFELIATFIETVSGEYGLDAKRDLAKLIIDRYFSDDYPDKWDEIIWKKGEDGMWSMIPENVSLEDVEYTKETIDAIYLETLYQPCSETDISTWEETYAQ